jgi:hypothetical protein
MGWFILAHIFSTSYSAKNHAHKSHRMEYLHPARFSCPPWHEKALDSPNGMMIL